MPPVMPTQQPSEVPNETTSLLGRLNDAPDYSGDPEGIDPKWDEPVLTGDAHTTWSRETMIIGTYAMPLVLTFLLQYSLTVASIFTVGHLGKRELGGVSLASMSASITGYAVYQGLATSLDTLCSQAYGSGRKTLVGLQMQRTMLFLWTITIPIALLWWFADTILLKIVPDSEVALLAGLYLKILIMGAPGYACFECGKRYMQAQGLFSASLYILLICAPLNAFLNWLFVWVCFLRQVELISGYRLTNHCAAFRLGIRWCPNRRGDHGQRYAFLAVSVCEIHCRIRMLGRNVWTGLDKLVPDDPAGSSGPCHGGGRVPSIRNPNTSSIVSRHRQAGRPVCPGNHLQYHVPNPLPPLYRQQHSHSKPDRFLTRRLRENLRSRFIHARSHCRSLQRDPSVFASLHSTTAV